MLYFKEKEGQIFNGNCVDIMKDFEEKSIDLIVTSPPYDNLRDYKGYDFNFPEISKSIYRILKNGGVLVWVVGDQVINGSESGTSFKQVLSFLDLGFKLYDTMIYMKKSPQYPDINRYIQVFEYMFVFCKGKKPKTINLIADRKNIWERSWGQNTKRLKDGTLVPNNYTSEFKPFGIRTNIWKYNTGYFGSSMEKIAFEHPAIFPEKLANDHIQSWSNKGDMVLDPMCGSGTTCKMAKLSQRKYIGIDISQEYCEITKKRLLAIQPSLL